MSMILYVILILPLEKEGYSMSVTIRNVEPNDLNTVYTIEAACFPKAEAASLNAFRERIAAFPESFFIAEKDSTPVGFINGGATDAIVLADALYDDITLHNPNGAYQAVFGLDVLPAFQHQGIAQLLMHHFIDIARQNGRTGVILTCKDRLIGFYEQFGYRHLGISASCHGGAVWHDMLLTF